MTFYYEAATKSNIDQIVKKEAQEWLMRFEELEKTCLQHWMLISRAIHIENENVNLDKGTQETAQA